MAWAALAALAMGVPSGASAEENARGAELFELCLQCHGSAGEGNHAALAPSIAGLEEWYVLGQLKNFQSGARVLFRARAARGADRERGERRPGHRALAAQ